MSKKLDSILSQAPRATAPLPTQAVKEQAQKEKTKRLVAEIPATLKREVRDYLDDHTEETEATLILKGLKLLGFNISSSLLIDKRKTR